MLTTQVTDVMAKKLKSVGNFEERGVASHDTEVAHLKRFYNENWLESWWVPINWSCKLVRDNCPKHIASTEQANLLIEKILDFKHNLDVLLEYNHNPLPGIAEQAVTLVCWGFVFLGMVAYQKVDTDDKKELWDILEHFVSSCQRFLICFFSLQKYVCSF